MCFNVQRFKWTGPNIFTRKVLQETFVSHGLSTQTEISSKLVVPQPTVEALKQCFTYRGPRPWNNLPDGVKNCDSIDTFKFIYERSFNMFRLKCILLYIFCCTCIMILCILTVHQGSIYFVVIFLSSLNKLVINK